MAKRCKYCGSRLADDGFCGKPCAPGQLEREIAEEKQKQPEPAPNTQPTEVQ